MEISRELVLKIIRYLINNQDFYFPFKIVCKDFDEDDESYEIEFSEYSYDELCKNENMNNFVLEENLQNLYKETIQLMSKGFIEKIINESVIKTISILSKNYNESWKKDLCKSENIEEFGLNEFIGGRAEAYEDCLRILKENE